MQIMTSTSISTTMTWPLSLFSNVSYFIKAVQYMSKHSVLYQMYDRSSDFTTVNILCTSDPTYHCLLKQKSSNCVIWTSIRLTYRYGEFCSKINIVKISETLII